MRFGENSCAAAALQVHLIGAWDQGASVTNSQYIYIYTCVHIAQCTAMNGNKWQDIPEIRLPTRTRKGPESESLESLQREREREMDGIEPPFSILGADHFPF